MARWVPLLLLVVVGCASGSRRIVSSDTGGRDSAVPDSSRPDTFVPGRDAAVPDTSRPDAGFDAGFDAALPTDCSDNADCQDGNACNGMELCIGTTCMPGTPIACDDGVACTVDSCSEPGGTCVNAPNDSLCGSGESCIATGCTPGGPTCSETPCRVISPQCGCLVGEGCYIDVDGNPSCSSAGGVGEGGACTAITDCMPGLSCIGIGGGRAACHKLCNSDIDCSTGSLCIIGLEDSMMRPLTVSACTIPCDPAAQTGCPTGAHCFLGSETAAPMRPLTHCDGEPAGTRGQGLSCTSDPDCRAGFICLQPDAFSLQQCLQLCRNPRAIPGPSADCPGVFEDCYGFDPPLQVGFTTYGVCWDGF